jgi:hypothetical protein
MRAAITGVLAFLAALGALQVVYPWSTYYGNFNFGWWPTAVSYVIVAALPAFVGALTMLALLRARSLSTTVRAVGSGVITFIVAVVLALLFGPGGVSIPGTRVRGIFFSEWRFLNFVFLVAGPVSALVALLFGWAARRRPNLRVR